MKAATGTYRKGGSWTTIVETANTLQAGVYYVLAGANISSAISTSGVIGLRITSGNTLHMTRLENIITSQNYNRIQLLGRVELSSASKLQLQVYHNTSESPMINLCDIVAIPINNLNL